jgi:type II secretion system (T2SS) protein M
MIALTWSKHDQRVLLFGGLVLSGLVGASRGVPLVVRWSADRRAAALSLVRQAALADGADRILPVLADSLAARRRRLDMLDTMLVSASTVAEAGARLSNVISEYADARSVRVLSLQLRPDSTERRGFAQVAVRMTGVADVAGLTSLLGDVESSTPILAVRDLGITQPDPAVPDSKAETLRFELWVEALAVIHKVGR